jgi:hypothetical protein
MGILVTLAGLIALAYTVSSGLGLFLARQAAIAAEAGVEPRGVLAEAPPHHRALLAAYAVGPRLLAWRASFACMMVTLVSLAMGTALTPYAFGMALIIDCVLFLTFKGRHAYLAAASASERLIDAAQCVALLFAFTVLAWTRVVLPIGIDAAG